MLVSTQYNLYVQVQSRLAGRAFQKRSSSPGLQPGYSYKEFMHDFGYFWTQSRAIGRRRSFQNSAILEQKSGSRKILGPILAIFELRVHWQTQECAEAFRSRNFGVFALADAGVAKTVISCDFCKGYIEQNRSEPRKNTVLEPIPGHCSTQKFPKHGDLGAKIWVPHDFGFNSHYF